MAHENFGISTAKADSDDDLPDLMKVSAKYDLLEDIHISENAHIKDQEIIKGPI